MSEEADSASKPAEGEGAAPSGKSPMVPALVGSLAGAVVTALLTQFVLIPKIKNVAHEAATAAPAEGAKAADAHGGGHAAEKPEKAEKAEKKKDDGHGGGGGDAKDGPKAVNTKDGWIYPFPAVNVNLAGTLGRQVLKVNFNVVSGDKAISNLVEENKSKLKSEVLTILSSRTLSDVESAASKQVLRTELKNAMNKVLNSSQITDIQFNEFLIQ